MQHSNFKTAISEKFPHFRMSKKFHIKFQRKGKIMTTKELDKEYVAGTYARFDVAIKSGKGSTILDEDGKEYIDFGSGIAVNTFGAADDIWKQAIINQLDKIQHTSNLYYNENGARLAQMLCERTGMKKVFLSN